ncbi:hypothetical protein JOF36_003629 [Pseudonocardia parietis]|uniref:DUF222 domain-containing protein n=1 Tax=Pseudonocardia parietis TaxID=570936 RepID=A0ABS4VVI3_9PSEU|nr:hypothetical protein [Pseudonocardia parietis]
MSADGDGVVSHVGSRLLADPGRIPVDVASALADGATTICEIAVLADQEAVFGAVASDSTVWRLLGRLDGRHLAAVAAARARAREVVWDQHAERHGGEAPKLRNPVDTCRVAELQLTTGREARLARGGWAAPQGQRWGCLGPVRGLHAAQCGPGRSGG